MNITIVSIIKYLKMMKCITTWFAQQFNLSRGIFFPNVSRIIIRRHERLKKHCNLTCRLCQRQIIFIFKGNNSYSENLLCLFEKVFYKCRENRKKYIFTNEIKCEKVIHWHRRCKPSRSEFDFAKSECHLVICGSV